MTTTAKLTEEQWREIANKVRAIRERVLRLSGFCTASGLPKYTQQPLHRTDELLMTFISIAEDLMFKQGILDTSVFYGGGNKTLVDLHEEYQLDQQLFKRSKRIQPNINEWRAIGRETKVVRAELHHLIRFWQSYNLPIERYISCLLRAMDQLESFRKKAAERMRDYQKIREFDIFYGVDRTIDILLEDESFHTTVLGNPKIDLTLISHSHYSNGDNPKHINEWKPEEQRILVQWINENLYHSHKFSVNYSSYNFKHRFEESESGFYVSNGAFKAAMVRAGFDVQDVREQNWYFNVSENSPAIRKREWNWKV